MMRSIAFAGVACNRAIYDPHNNANEEMLACQLGGLQTVYNTGPLTIFGGDIVYWGAPDVHPGPGALENTPKRRYSPGAPRSKRVFSTNRLTPAAMAQEIADTRGANVVVATFNLQRRVIGKAMSTAKPGQPHVTLSA